LGTVFDDRADELDVAHAVYLAPPLVADHGVAVMATYNVDPFPARWHVIFGMTGEDQRYDEERADDAARYDAQHHPAWPLSPADVEAPDGRKELRVRYEAEHEGMSGKRKVVQAHGRLRGDWVALGILVANGGRPKEGGCRYCVGGES
jgi:hypothetical protein